MTRINWDIYALKLAKVASLRSEDPYVQVGACILRQDNSVASLGYNGAPKGVEINWDDRDERRQRVVHAEANALRYIQPNEAYLLACTLLPCNDCLRNIASYGIKNVIYEEEYERDASSLDIAKELGIIINKYEC